MTYVLLGQKVIFDNTNAIKLQLSMKQLSESVQRHDGK